MISISSGKKSFFLGILVLCLMLAGFGSVHSVQAANLFLPEAVVHNQQQQTKDNKSTTNRDKITLGSDVGTPGTSCTGTPVISDDFNNNVLNTNIWGTKTPHPQGNFSVSNGQAVFTGRPYLYAKQQYKPTANSPVCVSGTFKIGWYDFFQLHTRSDNFPEATGNHYEVNKGLEFAFTEEFDNVLIQGRGGVIVTNQVTTGTLTTINRNDIFTFRAIDDGLNAEFIVVNVSTGQYKQVTAQSTTQNTSNYVLLHNRETSFHVSYLDNINIHGTETAPNTGCNGPAVINENFDLNVMDPGVLATKLPHPQSKFRLINGQAEFTSRAYLYSTQQYKPTASAPICVTGTFKIGSYDFFQLHTRSDNTPETTGNHYDVSNGLEFAFTEEFDSVLIQGRGGVVVTNQVAFGNLTTINANDVFAFKAIDDGLNAEFIVVNVATGKYKYVTAQSATQGSSNYVVLHNRETNAHVSYLNNLAVHQAVEAAPSLDCAGPTVINDNFDSNVLDSNTWLTKTVAPGGTLQVVNGQVEFYKRPYLYSKQQYKPSANSPLCITGTFKIGSYDLFQILTRSSNTASGQYYETSNGLEFEVVEESNSVVIEGRGVVTYTNRLVTGNLVTINADDVFKFKIVDNGSKAEFILVKVATGEYKRISVDSTTPGLTNYVLIHNREVVGKSYLDDIAVYQDNDPVRTISAVAGTPQTTAPNTAFAKSMIIVVKNSSGVPMSDTQVVFNAPTTGASGKFSGNTLTYTATTNSYGQVIVPSFTANGRSGTYTVTATVVGKPEGGVANFVLTNGIAVQP